MVAALNDLSTAEKEVVFRAPLLVCLLIAGADGKVDRKEMKGAMALSRKKTGRGKGQLFEFYGIVTQDFEDKLKIVMQSLPVDVRERTREIVRELTSLNIILPKVDKAFGNEFHVSLKYIAAKIAESSGGLLGIKSVGEDEERYMNLPMIKAPA